MHGRVRTTLWRWASIFKARARTTAAEAPSSITKVQSPSTTATPVAQLPQTPRELIARRDIYEIPILHRRINRDEDEPLAALYRTYEHLVLDQHIQLRNEIEAFWWHPHWPVKDIPDPRVQDSDPERLTCLACITKLFCVAFNERIELGMPRASLRLLGRSLSVNGFVPTQAAQSSANQ